MTSRTLGGRSIHWTVRTHEEQGHLTEFSMSSRSSDRAPVRCLRGHGFDSCWGLRVFSLSQTCVMLINSPLTFHYRA